MSHWHRVCPVEKILPDTGVCALIDGVQVAVFRVGDRVFALGNRDPFSGANVLSRGIVGDKGGVLEVASPMYKHSFCLETGRCLDEPGVSVPAFAVRIRAGVVEVAAPPRSQAPPSLTPRQSSGQLNSSSP